MAIFSALRDAEANGGLAFEMVRWRGREQISRRWTRSEFAAAVARAGAVVARQTRIRDRVVVALPPGPPFAIAFLGCLAAGRIAVPAQTPATARARRMLDRLVDATQARLTLTDETGMEGDDRIAIRAPGPDAIAYIQFTSGSTQSPRGAVISHGALAANLTAIGDAWRLGPADHGVFWLPPFHDMGLVGALLTPVAFGFPATLMHPAAFLQQPARWLELIAARRATFSGAPNFAYDLCVDRGPGAAALDLSSWRVAVNGAEPVSAATLDRFAKTFAPAGFDRRAFAPGYGLAEAVLFVTARRADEKAAHTSRGGVCCGAPGPGMSVRIVDESSGMACADGETGEIWITGPSLASGYWQAPEETAFVFGARLAGDDRAWLRTGDLGFLRDGELHVCGRRKDVIVRAGRKIHAADAERAIAAALGGSGRRTAVFSCPCDDGPERLVVVHEADADDDRVRRTIADALGEAFDLLADDIVLAAPGAVRVTASGKIARATTRDAWRAGAIARVPRLEETHDARLH